MAHFIDLNERFHVFSKSPVAAGQTLAGVRNKSGHTVTTSDIWGEDIPGFFKAYTADMKTAFLAFAKENDMCEYDGTLYYCKEGAWHSRPALVADEKFYNESAAKSKDKVYNDGVTNVAYAGSITPVIRYHQNRPATLLNDDNNNKAPGNNYSVRIYPSDDSVNFVSSFVSSMDKFVNGTPSSKFDPVVVSSISTEGTLLEGTNEADYIANCYAGIIQFNKTRANAPKTITISAFEYIGKKLDSTINSIYAEIESIIGATMEGVVASVGVTTDAENAGISVDDESKTAPKIHITTGSITSSDTKLVTGKAVYDYVSGATLNSGTQGDNQIQSATGETANKLVTAAQVKEYVTENAQVTVTVGSSKKTSTGFEFAGSTGTDIAVAPTMDANGKVTYAATLSKATVGTDGKILTGDENKAVSAGDAKTIVDTSIAALSATGGAIATLTERVGQAEANADASAKAASASQTAAEGAKSEAAAAKTAAQNAQTAAEGAQSAAQAAQAASEAAKGEASASATAASQSATAAQGSATSASQSATAASAAQSAAEAAQSAAESAAAEAKAAKEFVETTAEWQAGTDEELGDFTTATASGVVTGTTVKTVADEVLTLAKSYSDSLHTTSLDYVVLGDSESLPTASAATLGKIYLVSSRNAPSADGAAISGSYVEYMTRKVSETEYTWEKIGTTEVDLTSYAKFVTINGQTYNANVVSSNEIALGTGWANKIATGQATTLANQGSVYANIANNGTLTLGVVDATTAGKGLVKLAANVADGSTTDVTTAKAVKEYAQKALTVKDGRDSVTANDLWGTTATLDENGNLTVAHNWVTNPNISQAWNTSITKVEDNKAYVDSTLYANVQTSMIKNGENMFYSSSISEFESDLSNMTDGSCMFDSCASLTSFNSDLTNLTDGTYMFHQCSNLTRLYGGNSDLSLINLKEGNCMFKQCALTSFTSDMPSLTLGTAMFSGCSGIMIFYNDLSNLMNGEHMFSGCSKLESFTSLLPSLTLGNNMFSNCPKLTTFSSTLPNLRRGYSMFYGCSQNLTSFTSDMPSLTDAEQMFMGCSNLKTFSSDLSSLTEATRMFYQCSALESFCGDLSSLTNGNSMFALCSKLKTFSADLSSLTNGDQMFNGCQYLESFCGDLSSLTRAWLMFSACKLDTESVEIIADTINTVTSARIDIKIGNTTPNDEEDAAFKQMKDKGWQVYVNGSQTEYVPRTGEASLDETGETTVAPKPYWAKPIEVTEEEAEFVGEDGKFYQVVGGQFIYVSDPDTYGMFVSREDAIANMRLTKYVKPVEEEI